jgi:hypothetical protein
MSLIAVRLSPIVPIIQADRAHPLLALSAIGGSQFAYWATAVSPSSPDKHRAGGAGGEANPDLGLSGTGQSCHSGGQGGHH